jgi:hypothetical protein
MTNFPQLLIQNKEEDWWKHKLDDYITYFFQFVKKNSMKG